MLTTKSTVKKDRLKGDKYFSGLYLNCKACNSTVIIKQKAA